MKKKLAIITVAFLFSIPLFVFAAGTIQINPNIPGTNLTASSTPGAYVANFYQFALLIAGVLALGAIVYGGVKYATSAGNPSAQSDGKEWILSAIYGLLLLAGAYLILYTINPNLVNLNSLPTLPPVTLQAPASTGGGGTGNPLCDDLPALAKVNNEPYPAQNAGDLNTLISCASQHAPSGGTPFTSDQSHPTCNYSRGAPSCESCSHAQNSCHYGGYSGTNGAEAADFEVAGQAGQTLVNAIIQYCGVPAGRVRCEAASGVTVPCVGGGATHVHADAPSCDAN